MKKYLFLCAAAFIYPTYLYALAPADDTPDTTSSAVVVDTAVDTTLEIRNNSKYKIYVIQKGLKRVVEPKEALQTQNYTTLPVSVTPADDTPSAEKPSFKYVTVIGKQGPCKVTACLIVQ